MPKLLYASTSPYSSKVRMAAAYAGIAIDLVPVKTEDKPAELISANPLGKIPVLVLEDGRTIHDSRAITQHLNRLSKNVLFPRNPDKRLEAEVLEALADGISIDWLTGRDITERVWDDFFAFYMDTGGRKWGRPYLNRQFFSLIGERMAEDILLVMAKRNGRYIAGAINFIGSDALYGRNWGCIEDHPFLHFEVCYHQAIDFAIERKLKVVEAGAQGEHKLARGYQPVTMHSAHYIAHPG
ncbi:MAG: GNAT family N-acetyltransferase, partial [Mesorhizobium sp.]